MLRVKALVFIQEESHDGGDVHLINIYDRKILNYFIPSPMESSEKCILENVKKALDRLYENVEITLKAEAKYDLNYVCEKNAIPISWEKDHT